MCWWVWRGRWWYVHVLAFAPMLVFVATLRGWAFCGVVTKLCFVVSSHDRNVTPALPFSFCSRWLIPASSMSTQSGKMALTTTWENWCTSGSMAIGLSAVWRVGQVGGSCCVWKSLSSSQRAIQGCPEVCRLPQTWPRGLCGNKYAGHGLRTEAVFPLYYPS